MEQRTASAVSAALRLFELAPRITRMENAVLGRGAPPLTFRQFRLLGRIAEGDNTITRLGRFAPISLPAISESVEGLVQKGLVRRTADPRDRRTANLELTEAGLEALSVGEELLTEAAEQLLVDIPETRRHGLETDLTAIDGCVADYLRRESDVAG